MNLESENVQTGSATYCPEDNKLRLYVGRVPRPEYDALRAEGWTATPKQDCQFVAHWTPDRRDTALAYGEDFIGDEDQSPAERAADRAERFGVYRDKRTDEATGHADRYDDAPAAHGFQSQARAERAAARHDRTADRAGDAWGKAEYWQSRTAGVISHALHVSSPDVRMGRIKILESEIRKAEKRRADYDACFNRWTACAAMTDPEAQTALALKLAYVEHGDYTHPRSGRKSYLYDHARREELRNDDPLTGAEVCALWLSRHGPLAPEGDWLTHYRLRLAYEEQMMQAQGGRAAHVEMIAGGWIGSKQIQKVNKSTATGRVVSVNLLAPTGANYDRKGKPYGEDNPRPLTIHTVNIERCSADVYRAPTAEELAAFEAEQKQAKKARKASAPAPLPLINPTDAEAARLVEMWNAARRADHETRNIYKSESARASHTAQFKPCEVRKMPQAFYSEHSKGAYAKVETQALCSLGRLEERNRFYDYSGQAQRKTERGPALCQIRTTGFDPVHVIILTDKSQKPLPVAVWQAHTPASVETVNA